MPCIEYPLAYVFIGRKHDLDKKTRRKLRRLVYDNRMFAEIHTLDFFAGAGRSVKGMISDDKGGQASTHTSTMRSGREKRRKMRANNNTMHLTRLVAGPP